MKTIQRALLLFLLTLTLLWLWPNATGLLSANGVFAWRTLMVQYSGVLGIGVMSLAMLLAVRPNWIEHRLHGLDKMYRLHKWLGIAGLVIAVTHWLWAKAPKWMVQAGWLERPVRGKRPEQTLEIFRFFQSQRGLAEQIGEWAFYIAVGLIAIALIKRFPYRHFFKTHRWLALVYLALVWHGVVLLQYSHWTQPLGWLVVALMLLGCMAAAISLLRRIGIHRKAVGTIESIERLTGVDVTAVTLQLQDRWPGHEAGQFAFVTFNDQEGAHPFTISSAWRDDGQMRFLIKALGDYTQTLAHTLHVGDTVLVEGPYGRFNFEGVAKRQIWIGAGIGISPFVARLQTLATRPDGREIDLFHSTTAVDEMALQRLATDTQAAGVKLHLFVSSRNGRLTGEHLRQTVPDWKNADIWFCGPAAFGNSLRQDLVMHGLPTHQFHQELFEMR